MPRGPEADALFTEAFDLAILLQEAPTPERLAAARAWIARGPDHAAVWAEVMEIHGMAGSVLAGRRRARRAVTTRRAVLATGLAGLAAAGAWRLGPEALARLRADVTTATAEVRRLVLPDGTVAVLGPETALALAFSPAARGVRLLAGMGFFEVAPDPAGRPFSVVAGTTRTRAGDAAFEIRADQDPAFVAVARGEVALSGAAGTVTLGPGEAARGGPGGGLARLGTEVADWRSGIAVADEEPVAALAARIAPWRAGPVLVRPGIAGRRVSGVFDLTRPEAALDAVVRPFGGRVRRLGPVALLSAG
ncbi:MAG: iron dicitrate transport regulator FecR [Rhodovulum sulfidophilum]|uniref:Iron dicitrate transport regulator FecR n=1 Tax=Rhodovulum sulfidophilum TaxID=35806 RepID=A0A2W5N6E2_RHOSU|nr:MAG: iron dicitrate transport regulator FecR [Rhodovulum sulfidophilum]